MMPDDTPDRRVLVTVNGACARAGVTRRTIYNWIDSGKVDYIRTAGGQIRICVDSLFRQPNGDRLPR